jgi:hypothetical protein
MNFLLHNVEPATMDAHFELDAADIAAVLREAGPAVLGEKSIYNISIFDELLGGDDKARIYKICSSLIAFGPDEMTFIGAYLSDGSKREKLIAKLSWLTEKIFLIVRDAEIDEALRIVLFDAALAGGDDSMTYENGADGDGESVAALIEKHHSDMPVLTHNSDVASARSAATILRTLGVKLPTISCLSAEVLEAVVERRLYLLTLDNLREALGGAGDVALDAIKKSNSHVYDFALGELRQYLDIILAADVATIRSPSAFIEVITDVAEREPDLVETVARRASNGCRLELITSIREDAWPGLFAAGRVDMKFRNVQSYLEVHGLDANIGAALESLPGVLECGESAESERANLAVQILNAPIDLISVDARVRLAQSLQMTELIPADRIQPLAGDFIGLLLKIKLIPDTIDSFRLTAGTDWPSREYAISQSESFQTYFSWELIPPAELELFFGSDNITNSVKLTIFLLLNTYPEGIGAKSATAAAVFANKRRLRLSGASVVLLLDNGATSDSILNLLPSVINELTDAEVLQVLERLPSPYSQLASDAESVVDLPLTDPAQAIAGRFKIGSWSWQTRTSRLRSEIRFTRR